MQFLLASILLSSGLSTLALNSNIEDNIQSRSVDVESGNFDSNAARLFADIEELESRDWTEDAGELDLRDLNTLIDLHERAVFKKPILSRVVSAIRRTPKAAPAAASKPPARGTQAKASSASPAKAKPKPKANAKGTSAPAAGSPKKASAKSKGADSKKASASASVSKAKKKGGQVKKTPSASNTSKRHSGTGGKAGVASKKLKKAGDSKSNSKSKHKSKSEKGNGKAKSKGKGEGKVKKDKKESKPKSPSRKSDKPTSGPGGKQADKPKRKPMKTIRNLNLNLDPASVVAAGAGVANLFMN